jgi:hypothetical protein
MNQTMIHHGEEKRWCLRRGAIVIKALGFDART